MNVSAPLAALRQNMGADVVFNGTTYKATNKPIEEEQGTDFLPDGAGKNVTNQELWLYSFTESDFAGNPPRDGDTLTRAGVSYTVLRSYLIETAGTRRCVVYRTPSVATSAQDTAQSAVWAAPPT